MSKKAIKKGLSDKKLAAKYDTGGTVNFAKALKKMSKPISISKTRQKH